MTNDEKQVKVQNIVNTNGIVIHRSAFPLIIFYSYLLNGGQILDVA